ncbi:23S rRNA (adenine(2030)-N(6))-methyltransferase RlmJ [Yoonia sp.]|uniref:23S rRNA (adenine(2030)-N(6))-methyltransferase RlmJ n=1 Tax=Yoonia sp. TaxID=2212373 RepID=UPI003A4E0A7D
MLSYQHAYHAGNLADVHKHSLLAWMLDYLTRKDKALSYLETHAGRGLYDLTDEAAVKTGEAAKGIAIAADWFAADHPYARVLARIRTKYGANAYPGSPIVAAESLRPIDSIQLSELHPQEYAALAMHMAPYGGVFRQRDGYEMALSVCPPEPRRGLMLVDPSFEVKSDYDTIPPLLAKVHRKWGVGILVLWYPLLSDAPHLPMVRALRDTFPDGLCHEVGFPPARPGHRMVGSGLFVVNPPYGLLAETKRLSALFDAKLKQN